MTGAHCGQNWLNHQLVSKENELLYIHHSALYRLIPDDRKDHLLDLTS